MILQRYLRVICDRSLIVLVGLLPLQAGAEFSLNFMPDGGGAMSTTVMQGNSSFGGQTPFLREGGLQLPEIVVDPDTGLDYYHMIIGSLADGFIQETYIERGFSSFPNSNIGSAVGGDGGISGGNGRDPLDTNATINTANAEANPRKVLIRQIISDGEIVMEFLKDRFDYKPLIVQQLNAPDIRAVFEIDMRNSTYDDMSNAGIIYNTLSLPGLGTEYFKDFNYAQDTQDATISGGLYKYTEGTGPGGSDGTYEYVDAMFDHKSQAWGDFLDPSEPNPWSYENAGNKP